MKLSNTRLRRLERKLGAEAALAAQAAEEPRQPTAFVAVCDAERSGAGERLVVEAVGRGGYVASALANRWPEPELGPRTTQDGWLFERGTHPDIEAEATPVAEVSVTSCDVIVIPPMGADVGLVEATIDAVRARWDKPA